jgi:type I restriction enzyme S subunit
MTLLKEVPVAVTRCPVTFNQDVRGLLVDKSRILPEFLAYFLLSQSQALLGLVTQAGHGTGRLSADALAEFEVLIPPLPVQHKIVSALGTWEQSLAKMDALRTAKETRLLALRAQLLSGKRRFPQFGRTKWRRIQLSEVLKHIFRSVNWSPSDVYRLISIRRRCGGLFRREDLRGADYKTTDLHEIRTGDFLVSKRQVVHGAWGMVTKEFSGCHVSKEYSILVNKAPDVLHMPFFDWLCHEQRMWHLAFLASDGVHREKLIFDSRDFLRHYIELPPTIEEQERIVQVLDACDSEIRLLEAELEALKQQKRGLMQKLLTGEIRVNTNGKSK